MKIREIHKKKFEFKQSYLLVVLLLIMVFFFVTMFKKTSEPALVFYSQIPEREKIIEPLQNDLDFKSKIDLLFSSGEIDAKTLIIFDRNNQEFVYQTRSDEKIPSASLIKVLSAWFFSEKINQAQPIKVSEQALKTPGDSNLIQDASYYARDLIDLLLIASSNDATMALYYFLQDKDNPDLVYQEISDFAKEKGLLNFKINSLTGLDDEEHASSFILPIEFVLFINNFLNEKQELAKVTTNDVLEIKSLENLTSVNINTNPKIKEYKQVTFSKTGFTKSAEGSIVWQIKDQDNDYIVLIMGSGFNSRFDDFAIINDLILLEG